MTRVFRTERLLARSDRWIAGGGLLVVAGKVERVLTSSRAVARAAAAEGVHPVDTGDTLVAPGLVDAHAHLDLSALGGEIAPGGAMVEWISDVVARRAGERAGPRLKHARRAAAELVASGTTLVGDIDSTGVCARIPWREAPRRVAFREALDAGDPARRDQVVARLGTRLAGGAFLREGISPHAPHTVSSELLASLGRLAARRRIPVQVHWSETEEEVRWLSAGEGPFARLLRESPLTSGLDLLERARLLGKTTSLVHGNFPGRGEPARIAQARATVVHCPGSHAFFDRAPFPLERYVRAGVSLALGTDSLASNDRLDMRREMALLRSSHPSVGPGEVFDMATRGGARALGLAGLAGELRAGAFADLVCFEVGATGRDEALDELSSAIPPIRGVWMGGVARALGAPP